MSATSAEIRTEHAILIGAFLATLTYGIHLTLFFWCFRLLISSKDKIWNRLFLLTFIILLVIFGSIGHGVNVKLMITLFIDKRNLPALQAERSIGTLQVLANAANFLNLWLQDGLLLYRFWVFWHNGWFMLIIPSLMYPASLALSLMLIVEELKPGILIWSKISVNLGVPYWSISIVLNILITLSIAGRLMMIRYQQQKMAGLRNPDYLSTSAMLVESAALYTTVGLIFVISYATNSVVQHYTIAALAQVQCISPLLIIIRVIEGKAWSRRAVDSITARHIESEIEFVRNASSTPFDTVSKKGISVSQVHHTTFTDGGFESSDSSGRNGRDELKC